MTTKIWSGLSSWIFQMIFLTVFFMIYLLQNFLYIYNILEDAVTFVYSYLKGKQGLKIK